MVTAARVSITLAGAGAAHVEREILDAVLVVERVSLPAGGGTRLDHKQRGASAIVSGGVEQSAQNFLLRAAGMDGGDRLQQFGGAAFAGPAGVTQTGLHSIQHLPNQLLSQLRKLIFQDRSYRVLDDLLNSVLNLPFPP